MEHVLVPRLHVLVLLVVEDVVGSHVCLGVAVLSSLGERDVRNLARVALDHDIVVLLQVAGRAGGAICCTRIRRGEITLTVAHSQDGLQDAKQRE